VDEERSAALREIDAAIRQKGFNRDWEQPVPVYRGVLDPLRMRIPVSVEISDTDFVKAPVVRLQRSGDARLKPVAHVAGPDGLLCYLDTRATVLDRYRPGETVVRCLVEAERVLCDALSGRSNQDFAGEFLNYWATSLALVDLADGFEGEATISWLNLRDHEHVMPLLVRTGDIPASFAQAHRAASAKSIPAVSERCQVVAITSNLTIDPTQAWPPLNIADLRSWLDFVGPKAAHALETIIRSGKGTSRWLAIKASNGCAMARIDIPARFDTPEFLVNRKDTLLSNLLREPKNVVVKRYHGLPVDEGYLYSRNLGGSKTLAGKTIGLIGCGTIGGFLAKQLAQSGAGSIGGRLLLFDNDTLQPGNLGRHILGVRDLGRNKAEGCRDNILADLPHINVTAESSDALQRLSILSRCALVIDATGEESLSIALNHHAVRHRPSFPPMLYVWLAGNGSIAQSLLCDGKECACYKCMKPALDGQPRYRAVRSDTEAQLDSNAACGDALFVPFPVSRAVAAAALGLEAALGWINGKPSPHFRNRLLEPSQAFNLKDVNPAPSASCPACGNGGV
jgi:molybdopterin/thiamine biosynthesis adenylyltransferase